MRLLRLVAAAAAILAVVVASAGASHDPAHTFSGNWTTKVEIFRGEKAGTIRFKAVTPAEGEAAIKAMGVSQSNRDQYCKAATPGQYYVGSYNGGIGEGYEAGGVLAQPNGIHAGCIDTFLWSSPYQGFFKNNIGIGELDFIPNGPIFNGYWGYGSDFIGGAYKVDAELAGHFPGDGAEDSPDTDGDGLPDKWEQKGYDANKDGKVDVKLPKMGADPRHKDIFVEVDMMIGHPLERKAIAAVVKAFAEAPVSNPDGRRGINLHVDAGPPSIMDFEKGSRWGELSRSDQLPHQEKLGRMFVTYWWGDFLEIKSEKFEDKRAKIFHYAITAHRLGGSEVLGAANEGTADFVLGLAATCPSGTECSGTLTQQEQTFMHELGHNLGLKHGGNTDDNYKPHYLSVMNYAYQGVPGRLFYSGQRSGTGAKMLAPLDENRLDETKPYSPGVLSDPLGMLYRCPDGGEKAEFVGEKVDWNCDGDRDGTVKADVNGDGDHDTLHTFEDWSHLNYEGGGIGGNFKAKPSKTTKREATAKQLLKSARVLAGDAKAPKIKVKGKRKFRGRRGRLLVVATDNKRISALFFGAGRRWWSFYAKPRARRLSIVVTVSKPGVYKLRASALDRIGNRSKTKKFTVVLRGRGRGRAAASVSAQPIHVSAR